jgi:demethylmenaquinone methyltransferase / 2-methoxy-6-polyprenyl-1,4-benzoquinol methylase
MFDAIAPRYDLLNHVLSAGLDRRWRTRAVQTLTLTPGARVLDLCTGTGDLALAAVRAVPRVHVIGVDFAGEMLRFAAAKVAALGLHRAIALVRGDGMTLPVRDATCDAATVGFGIRNIAEPSTALAEMARVLKPGGSLAILEFGQPRIPGVRTLYNFYFRYLLPWVGRRVSRHGSAYSYLPASVGAFPLPEVFRRTIAGAGFVDVRTDPLTFGIVYLYTARRRS